MVNNLEDKFYLKQTKPGEPKEYFKFIARVLEELPCTFESWHDLGCGSGEFLNYLSQRFPDLAVSGSDISDELINLGKQKFPSISFEVEDFREFGAGKNRVPTDIVSLIGVNGRFSETFEWLPQFINHLKNGGIGLIFDLFNPDPVDVSVLASKSSSENTKFDNTYFNLTSISTMEKEIAKLGLQANFYRFEMPYDLPKLDDPFRTFTIELANGRRMLANGLGQLFDLYLFVVRK